MDKIKIFGKDKLPLAPPAAGFAGAAPTLPLPAATPLLVDGPKMKKKLERWD